jgi:outer membrane autotransporter protein
LKAAAAAAAGGGEGGNGGWGGSGGFSNGGGAGGSDAIGTGNAGGGGGASDINGTSDDAARKGGAANGASPGTAGQVVGYGNAGTVGSANSGSAGGDGGDGGSATHTSNESSADIIGVFGGNGGRGGQGGSASYSVGGDGGDGGSASLTLTGVDIDVGEDSYGYSVSVVSGNGSLGAAASAGAGTGGTSGNGGDASLSTTSALRATGLVQVLSGGNGSNVGGTGGNAGFLAGSLAAPEINLTKSDGSLAFNIGTLNVTSGDTTLRLFGTTAGTSSTAMSNDGVYIGTALLGNGQLQVIPGYGDPGSTAAINVLQLEGRGTFSDANNLVTVDSLSINGGTLHDGNWDLTTRSYAISTDITLGAGGATVELNAGQDKTLSRILTGSGALTKTGAGTLTLSGANTYNGGTTVSAGTLAGNTTSLQGNITNNSQVEFNQTVSGTYAGILSGSGSLIKDGTGTLTLFNSNTYTGLTEVKAGTLTLSTGMISDKLALYDGTTFNKGSGGNPFWDGSTGRAYLSRLDVHGSATYTGNLDTSGGTMNFFVPSTMSGGTMLGVSGAASIAGSTVNVGIEGSSSTLQAGNQITLIDTSMGLTGTPANITTNGQGMQGVTLLYEFGFTTTAGQLIATVTSIPKVNDQTKALPEGVLAALSLTNLGADLLAGPVMDNAVSAARSAARTGVSTNYGLATFGALSGGWSRYNTGSHVDMASVSLMAGLAFGTDLAPGHLTLGAFFEYGNGSYDTYNSFSNAASVHGDGDIYHIGGGILGRMDFVNTGPGHFYAEASGRAGGVHNEYSGGDLRDAVSREADYDSSSAYYGLHLGTGYIWNVSEAASLDLHANYFWTRQEGDSVTLSTGDPVNFEDADSRRLRLGGRFAYAVNEYVSPYVGAAWEHEFDGRARAATNGFDIDAPELRGGTGIGELGLIQKPSRTLPLSFDLGVQGYTGKREGVKGSLQVRLEFCRTC